MKTKTLREFTAFLVVGVALCAVLMLVGCSSPVTVAPAPPSPVSEPVSDSRAAKASSSDKSFAPSALAEEERPGLATGWGERVSSPLRVTSFVRASQRPLGDLGVIYYNDRKGVEAMAGPYKNKTAALQPAANGAVEWGVKSGWGYADHFMAGGKRYVVGKKGRTYSLVVRNLSNRRLEAVLSVDGLDILDGKPASFRKLGYILAPGEELEIAGFRTSFDSVAAFEFANVSASYSNLRHGTTRDVGVIGLAIFTEKGSRPWEGPEGDRAKRTVARPFAEAPMRVAQ